MNKSFNKGLLCGIALIFLLGSTRNIQQPETIVGTYQVSTTVYQSNKTGKTYVIETVLNTKTGQTKSRKRVYIKKYKVIK